MILIGIACSLDKCLGSVDICANYRTRVQSLGMLVYRTRVRSLGMLVSDSLTDSLTDSLPFSKLD